MKVINVSWNYSSWQIKIKTKIKTKIVKIDTEIKTKNDYNRN